MHKKVTMEQIAKVAGVTRGTVDKVLHDRVGVSDEVRVNIKKIASTMGYKPNYVAKALASQKSITIGIINATTENPFYLDMKKGMRNAITDYKDFGISVRYREMRKVDVEEQIELIKELNTKDLSALIIVPVNDKRIQDLLNEIAKNGVKIIALSSKRAKCR